MKHFNIWQLADFARGLGDDATTLAVQTHLASGCSRCERSVKTMKGVALVARAGIGSEPPDSVLRYARALYSLNKPEKAGLPRLIGRLIQDTSLAPLPAGMRAESRSTRHLLFEAGNYYLDVQVQQQPGTSTVNLVGQLAGRTTPITTGNLPVWLVEGESLVASTVSNPLGEFALECAPARNLQLRVPLPAEGKRLEVSLRHVGAVVPRRRTSRKPR